MSLATLQRALLPGVVGGNIHILGKGIAFGDTVDGQMYRFYLASPPYRCQRNDYLLIYAHGNGETISDSAHLLDDYASKSGCYVVGVEYPGYGYPLDNRSPSTGGCEQALKALLSFAVNHWKFRTRNIILIGRSIGTGLVAGEAANGEFCGLILISPYRSIQSVTSNLAFKIAPNGVKTIAFGLAALGTLFAGWNTEDNVKHFRGPVAVMHGEVDDLIPIKQGEAVVKSAREMEGRLVIFKRLAYVGHNDSSLTETSMIVALVSEFLPTFSSCVVSSSVRQLHVPEQNTKLWI